LIYHGTLLLGIVGGLYTFVNLNLHKRLHDDPRWPTPLLTGLLLEVLVGGLIFTVGKILTYGQLTYYTIQATPGPEDITLFHFYQSVLGAAASFGALRWIIPLFGSVFSVGGIMSMTVGGITVRMLRPLQPNLKKTIVWTLLAVVLLALNLPVISSIPWLAVRQYAYIVLFAGYEFAIIVSWFYVTIKSWLRRVVSSSLRFP